MNDSERYLRLIELWNFPPSPEEDALVAELQTMPVRTVTRYPPDVLEWMRMPPHECHANALFMERNDPDGKMRRVSGWIIEPGRYVLHSVVDQGGELVCVTPAPMVPLVEFPFVPDPEIEWRERGEYVSAYRRGRKIGPGVRLDPLETIRQVKQIKERLRAGMNPYDAMCLP